MDEELYIPPCCIDRKLPPLLKSGGPCSVFYSQGDWGLHKLWHAASSLVNGIALTVLVVNTLDVYTLRSIEHHLRMEWSGGFILITKEDCTELVKSELNKYLNQIWYCPKVEAAAENNLWIRSTPLMSLYVSGPMAISDATLPKRVCTYNASFDRTDVIAKQAFRPWRSMARLHATIKGNNDIFVDWVK